MFLGFPGGLAAKESARSVRDLGLIPELGRSSREGKGYPYQYSGLENPMDCIVHGVAKSQTRLSNLHFHFSGKQVLREVFFSSPLYRAPLRQQDAAGVVGSNTSEDLRVCRSCGPVGQVGEDMCPKATSGSRAARCDRLQAERRGREAPLLAGRLPLRCVQVLAADAK